MINDLPVRLGEIKNIKSAVFADDLVIWTSVPKRQEYQFTNIMNEALTALGNWCNENAMTINTEKTFYQIFTLNHKIPIASLKINNKPVVETQEAKYLGMYLDGKLTLKNHVERTVEKLRKNCYEEACRKQME
jgi:hypothetical protein